VGPQRVEVWEVFNFEWRMVASFESLLKFIESLHKGEHNSKLHVGDLWHCMPCMESLGIIIKLFVQMIKILYCKRNQ
jgi:hypothetical protein